MDQEFIDSNNLKVDYGAVVVEVSSGSPAADAGLQPNDVIIKLNDTDIKEMNDLIGAVRDNDVGDKVRVTYLRDNEEKTVTMTLAEKPSN